MKSVIYAVVITFLWTVNCNAQSLLDSVYHYQKIKEHEKTIDLCERFVQTKGVRDQQKSEAYFAMGFSYNKLSQPANAIQSYLHSIAAYDHPKCLARAHYNIGLIYSAFCHYKQAIDHYDLALSLVDDQSKRGKYLVSRSVAFKYNGQFTDALNDVLEAQAIAFEDIENNKRLLYNAYNQRGLIKMAAGDYADAHHYFMYANDINIERKTYVNMGLNFIKAKKYDDAIQTLKKALDTQNNINHRFKAHQALGELYLTIKNYEEAISHLAEAETIYVDLHYPEAGDIEVFMTTGELFKQKGNASQSSNYFERAAVLFKELEFIKTELLLNAKKMELENTEKQFYARQKAEQEKQTALIIGGVTFGVLLLIIITLVYVYKTRRNRVERMKEDARSGIRTVLNISDELVDTE